MVWCVVHSARIDVNTMLFRCIYIQRSALGHMHCCECAPLPDRLCSTRSKPRYVLQNFRAAAPCERALSHHIAQAHKSSRERFSFLYRYSSSDQQNTAMAACATSSTCASSIHNAIHQVFFTQQVQCRRYASLGASKRIFTNGCGPFPQNFNFIVCHCSKLRYQAFQCLFHSNVCFLWW